MTGRGSLAWVGAEEHLQAGLRLESGKEEGPSLGQVGWLSNPFSPVSRPLALGDPLGWVWKTPGD